MFVFFQHTPSTLIRTHMNTLSIADRAIREMNRKEKDIVRAYFRAVKYASQIESRVRIMLIGDEESGTYMYMQRTCTCTCNVHVHV